MRGPTPDIFDEPDYLLIVADMHGIGRKDVHVELHEDVLTLTGKREDSIFRNEILLPRSFTPEQMRYACRNGILEIRLAKSPPQETAGIEG